MAPKAVAQAAGLANARETTFIVTAALPAGVSVTEFADHLADAHRRAVQSYDQSDPLSGAGSLAVRSAA